MAALSGTILASRIVPSDSADAYATHDADYGRGGYRSVADIAERDAITEPRRKLGMKVFVNSEQKEYQLIGGIENVNWTEVTGGSGSGVSTLSALTDTEIATPVNGQALVYDEAGQKWVNGDVGYGGALTIADATDTTITTPTAGQVLTYDEASGTWTNADAPTGGTDLTNYYTKDETYSKDEVDTAIDAVTPATLVENSSHITLTRMTQQVGSVSKYVPTQLKWFVVPFNYTNRDDLLQFDSATSTLTAKKAGYYMIELVVQHLQETTDGASAWTKYALARGDFDLNATIPTYGNTYFYKQDYTSEPVRLMQTISVYLEIGQSVKLLMYTGHSTAIIATSSESTLYYGTYMNMYMLSGVGVVNDGLNAYELAVQEGFVGTLSDWLLSINGDDGLSAYDVWLGLGNTGTEQQFIDSLKGMDGVNGTNGTDGSSAYQVWLNLGNTGTEQDFIDSLKGDAGATGATGATGVGVPTGGTAGQILAKIDATDYNTTWIDAPTGGGSAEYPDMTGNAGKVLGTDGTNVSWVDNGDAVALNMRYAHVVYDITSSPGAIGTPTNWLTIWYDNSTMDIIQKVSNSRLLLKAGRTYKIAGGVTGFNGSTTAELSTKIYAAKVSDSVFTEVQGGFSYQLPVTNAGSYVRSAFTNCYIKAEEDMWVECRVNYFTGTISYYSSRYTITEYLNVTGEGAITLPSVTNQSGKFLSNNGTDIEWVKPEFNGLSELPQYQLNTEVLTSERWIDGRPIYRKTIDFGALPNNTSKAVAHGISNIGTKWINHSKSRVGGAYPIDYPSGASTEVWVCWIDNTNVNIRTWTNRTAMSGIVTIEYTKTTDTASSPVALIGGIASISKKLPVFSAATNILTASGTLSFVNTYVDTVSMQSGNTIVIPENGIYELGISGNIDTIGQFGIVLNGTQLLYGYENDDRAHIGVFTTRQLVAGDVITFTYNEIQSAGAMLAGTAAFVTVKKISDSDGYITIANTSYDISSTEYVLPFTRNGKIVYGIEVDCGAMPNNTTKNVAIPNYNNAYDYDIVKFKASDSTYHINVPIQWNSTTYIERWITRASGSLTIVSNFNASSLTGKAVLEYTKD